MGGEALCLDLGKAQGCGIDQSRARRTMREQLGRLKDAGLSMILAEQSVRFVSGLGERVYILEKGMVRYEGSMAAFLADEDVRQTYLAL